MLFNQTEFDALVKPLLRVESVSPEDTVALIAFSHLCEPSDLLPNLLFEHVNPGALVEALIARADAAQIQHLVGLDTITDIADRLETDFAKLWGNATERWFPRLSKTAVVESLTWMLQPTHTTQKSLVLQNADDYPLRLSALNYHQPFVFWGSGDIDLLGARAMVGIVGTRQASRYGADAARDLAAVAAMNGIVTVSGGAFGIDAIIHESALALESPTVALMAGGLANLYPANNLQMLKNVEAQGLVLAELPPAVTPAKWRFLMRNRLIAALGQATVVVEAGRTSGALNTGRSAVAMDRPVAIVPGPMTSSRSVGCHDFLNAHLGQVQVLARPQDLVGLLGIGVAGEFDLETIGALEKRALDAFTGRAIETWEIQRLAGLTVRETQIALGSLEILGLIERSGSRYVRVV